MLSYLFCSVVCFLFSSFYCFPSFSSPLCFLFLFLFLFVILFNFNLTLGCSKCKRQHWAEDASRSIKPCTCFKVAYCSQVYALPISLFYIALLFSLCLLAYVLSSSFAIPLPPLFLFSSFLLTPSYRCQKEHWPEHKSEHKK